MDIKDIKVGDILWKRIETVMGVIITEVKIKRVYNPTIQYQRAKGDGTLRMTYAPNLFPTREAAEAAK